MAQDYYIILGVASDATPQDIKRAFRQIARECHPDVAGSDPAAEERFKTARKAYETLMDPVTRGRYDRRGQRRAAQPGGSFFDAFYRRSAGEPSSRTGPSRGAHDAGGHASTRGARKDPRNDLDLDDLFNDFGDFGFGRSGRKRSEPLKPEGPTPSPGADVHVEVDVPDAVARDGGSVTAVYHRMQRADSWRPGSLEVGLVRIQDIADVRVVPGTETGDTIRERGLGDAGPHGGPYGDLVMRVRVLQPRPREDGEAVVEVSVVEALLGGRVGLQTPQGPVRLTIPPGTSSGTRLRLKGKGSAGADLFVQIRIVVPRELDEESRSLIERFAELNPTNPRD